MLEGRERRAECAKHDAADAERSFHAICISPLVAPMKTFAVIEAESQEAARAIVRGAAA